MNNYILSIDQGTTGTTALLIDSKSFKFVDKINLEFQQIYPKPSWVEHDLNEIWDTVKNTITKLIQKNNINKNQIISIGITNQRETTCAFNKSGTPLANAIVWQDRRTSEFCEKNKSAYLNLGKISGLPLDPYFSSTKMKWLLENNQNVMKAAKENNLHLSTIDTFLLYKLSGHKSFSTEPTNASRTNLMNLKTMDWDEELLNFFSIDKKYLPKIQDTFSHFGMTSGLDFLPNNIPITCLFGDQQLALFGQTCINKGELKCTYGTGAFLLLNTGEEIIHSNNGLLTTVAYKFNSKKVYALEGSTYIAGAAVQWLRDNLNFFENSSEIEKLALEIKNLEEMEHILLLPFFTGIGSPYWKSDAKAALIGITRDTNKNHISRACLEGISLSINDLIVAFEKDGGFKINIIKVDGGATANNLLLQIQSNFINKKIHRPKNIETTSFGAALGSAIGNGQLDMTHLSKFWELDQEFNADDEKIYYKNKTQYWHSMVNKIYL